MTAYVQVVTAWPDGTTTTDVHRHPLHDRADVLVTYRLHALENPACGWQWQGASLTRHRTIHAHNPADSRRVVETITFHDTDPRQEAST